MAKIPTVVQCLAAAAWGMIAGGCGSNPQQTLDVTEPTIQRSVQVSQSPLDGTEIPKFVEPLYTLSDKRVLGILPVKVDMLEFQQKVLPESVYASLPAPYNQGTYVWGYKVGQRSPHWPGATIESLRHVPTFVNYKNSLTGPNGGPTVLSKYLTVDQTIHWADPLGTTHANGCMNGPPLNPVCLQPYTGPWPTTVHLHGQEDQSFFDGHPDSWFTPGLQFKGAAFQANPYIYPNGQEPTTLWFHDHALGITRLNIYAGLAAFYLLRDLRDNGLPFNSLRLPAGRFEQELMIQDRQFDTNGQLLFPDGHPDGLNGGPGNPDVHPYWIPEFFGDVMTVNGKSWPYFRVEPRRYRFRLLNASNARFLTMQIVERNTQSPGPSIWQIGSDGGLLNQPVKVADVPSNLALTLGVSERADVIVDFSGQQGKSFVLTNSASSPFPEGDISVDPASTAQIMEFRVNLSLSGADTSFNPAVSTQSLRLHPIVQLDPAVTGRNPDVRRQLVLIENASLTTDEPLMVMLNNTRWHGKVDNTSSPVPDSIANPVGEFVTEAPRVGSTEEWEIINLTDDAHPIHLHLVQFQELNRQDFNRDSYRELYDSLFPGGTFNGVTYAPGTYIPEFGPPNRYGIPNAAGAVGGNPDVTPFLLGAPISPPPEEAGWKDTMRMLPGQVSRVIVRWAPQNVADNATAPGVNLYPFDPTVGPGYVWHCHILDHEDNEMMRPYVVLK